MMAQAGDCAVRLVRGDVTDELLQAALLVGVAAMDLETTGLDWATCRIGTCQVFVPGYGCELVQNPSRRPRNLVRLLAESSVTKLFHHAMFDLRFMAFHWDAQVTSVACTKMASKLAAPHRKNHSLKPLLSEFLAVEIDKTEQVSDWTRDELSAAQLAYATGDVIHLIALHERLASKLNRLSLTGLYQRCLSHIPTRVELEIKGMPDVYAY